MTPDDRGAFGAVMEGLGEAFNEPVSEQRALIYFEALEDLPIDAVLAAAKAHVRAAVFFPRPAELRSLVVGNVEDRAELAWQATVREVRRVGWTGTPTLDAVTLRAALGLFGGGWRTLCEHLPASGPELLGYRKSFVAGFGAAVRQQQLGALPPSRSEAHAALADLKAALKQRGLPSGDL